VIVDGSTLVAWNVPRIRAKLGLTSGPPFSATAPLALSAGGVISMPQATASQDGWLSAADFASFSLGYAVELDIIAAEDLPAYGAVTSLGRKADSSNPSASFGRVVGLARDFIPTGFEGSVIVVGEITNPAWSWTPGDLFFLSGNGLSTTPPAVGFVQQLGSAKSATEIVVDLGLPILL
jgi:hypothetical protein